MVSVKETDPCQIKYKRENIVRQERKDLTNSETGKIALTEILELRYK